MYIWVRVVVKYIYINRPVTQSFQQFPHCNLAYVFLPQSELYSLKSPIMRTDMLYFKVDKNIIWNYVVYWLIFLWCIIWDCPFLIAPSVFYSVYLFNRKWSIFKLTYQWPDRVINANSALFQLFHDFQWNDDQIRFVLDQHSKLDFYSASSLKQQSADRHVVPLGHIILILSQLVFVLSL